MKKKTFPIFKRAFVLKLAQVTLHVGKVHKLGPAASFHGYAGQVVPCRKLTQKILDSDDHHVNKCETSDCMAELWLLMYARDGMKGRILVLMDGLGATSRAAVRNGFPVTAIEQDPEQFKISHGKMKDLPSRMKLAFDRSWRFPKITLCPVEFAPNVDKSYVENELGWVPFRAPYIAAGERFSVLSNATYAPLLVRFGFVKVFFFAHRHLVGL